MNTSARNFTYVAGLAVSAYAGRQEAQAIGNLQQCLQVCSQGIQAIEQMCSSFPHPYVRAVCYASRWSQPLCNGFCYWLYAK